MVQGKPNTPRIVPDYGRDDKPRFGDIGGAYFTDLPAERELCLDTIRQKTTICLENTEFNATGLNKWLGFCLPRFRQQAQDCVTHFDQEWSKCDAGGKIGQQARDASVPLQPVEADWSVAENQPCQVYNDKPKLAFPVTWSGACVDGRVSGEGRLVRRFIDGEFIYVGSMLGGKRHGFGTRTWAGGDRYEGEWREGRRHGSGTYTWASGGRYEGGWRDGTWHGFRTYSWPDDYRYEGEWLDGKRHGTGRHVWPNGDRYEGGWQAGKRHGTGTYTWFNGDLYERGWQAGTLHGFGTHTRTDGTTETCEWQEGELVEGTCK